jgi:hypothetical protein
MSTHGLPAWNWALQCVGIVCAYVGAELNSRLDVRGFHLWLFANVALFVVHTWSGLWVLYLLDLAYCRLNPRAIKRWRTDRVPRPRPAR